jgi:hypothetical protein
MGLLVARPEYQVRVMPLPLGGSFGGEEGLGAGWGPSVII